MSKKDLNINLSDISTKSGVYMFIDDKERVIYVGKAKSLRQRLSSYFNSGTKSIKTEKMLIHAKSLKTIVTENEVEAFLLEANLIKTEMPKYNVLLKDSKTYPYVKLTYEDYPRLIYTRQTNDDKASYFGPFVNVGDLRQIIELLQDTFPLRTCTDYRFKEGKICLKYQIKKCLAPCENLISLSDYQKIAESIKGFFKGDIDEVKEKFKNQMMIYSKNLDYENAAIMRDRILSLDKLFSKQSVSNISDTRSVDVFYKHEISSVTGVTQLFIRNGKLIGVSTHFFDKEEDELLERFVMQFYSNVRQFPELLALSGDEYNENLSEVLSRMANRQVHIKKRGINGFIELAKKNAEIQTEQYLKKVGERKDVSLRLAELVNIHEAKRIECIDISHLGGNYTVGVSVTTINGEFSKNNYRKYKIKSAENNDFQAMTELFERKGENIKDKSETEADLYIIDGGIGQLNTVLKAAKKAGFSSEFISISKSRSIRHLKNDRDDTIEEIHLPNRKNPVILKKNDPLLHFIQRIRDEAHRFAITFSRKLALKGMKTSPLLSIDGLGTKRLKDLLIAIPDIYNRIDITPEEIREKTKLPIDICKKIIDFINSI